MVSQSVLSGIRVLDFTRVLAGPYATRLLADFGAEVIKVQPQVAPEAEDVFARGYYQTWNRNKRGITLNLDKPEGIALAKRLAAISDIVVENFTPRVMANWGLDYASLGRVKPDIIMLSMSVMGSSGPWRNYGGFGATVQAFSGITELTTYPGKPPLGPGFSYADHVAGLYGTLAVLSALEYRQKTGEGQYLDLAEAEAMSSLLGDAILDYTAYGHEVAPVGNTSPQAAPHNVYPCRGEDRWCAIAVLNDADWQRFKKALGSPPWTEKERFAKLTGRLRNTAELDDRISDWTKEHTAEEVMNLLQEYGVTSGVVQDAGDLLNDPQLKARGFFVELDHPELGRIISDAVPIKLSQSQAQYHSVAPAPGQDNDYVYRQLLGMTKNEISTLRESGII